MRGRAVILMLAALALAPVARAGQGSATFYVQLVRGTDTDRPPAPGCKCVGRKLTGTFGPVFRCKSYWEMDRQQVALAPGQRGHVRFVNGREAEIDLSHPRERRVAAFQNGRLVDRTISPAGDAMTIIGGSRDARSVWFIVVRRDKPAD
jgi:hypothetical protein